MICDVHTLTLTSDVQQKVTLNPPPGCLEGPSLLTMNRNYLLPNSLSITNLRFQKRASVDRSNISQINDAPKL